MSSIFTVTGETLYNKTVLKTDTLKFASKSKLVLAPLESPGPGPRTLTILAKTIEIVDQAEITYDLDGRPGLDPDTPAPPTLAVPSSHLPIPPIPGRASRGNLLQTVNRGNQDGRGRGAYPALMPRLWRYTWKR